MISNHLSSCKSYQFENTTKDHMQIFITPTRQTTELMTLKLFLTLSFYQKFTVSKDFQIGIKLMQS